MKKDALAWLQEPGYTRVCASPWLLCVPLLQSC
jgi:hypothetical protein